jgi:hypothetical protein
MMEPPRPEEGTLEAWGSVLTTAAACGGVGAFIDFYIGKRGQQRVRSWMETSWLRLSYVRWGNLGAEEALFAVQVIDRLFGRRLFSIRRITAVAIVISASLCAILGVFVLNEMPILGFWNSFVKLYVLLNLFFIVSAVAVSLSITRFAAIWVASIITKAPYLNFLGFAFLLFLQYVMLSWWSPTIVAAHNLISGIALFDKIDISFRYDAAVFDFDNTELVSETTLKLFPMSPLYYLAHLESPIHKLAI